MVKTPLPPSDASRTLRVHYSSVEDLAVAYSRHISRGRLFVPTTEALAEGTIVRLEVELPRVRGSASTGKDDPKRIIETLGVVAAILTSEQAAPIHEEPGVTLELLEAEDSLAAMVAASLVDTSEVDEELSPEPSARVLVVDDSDQYRDAIADMMRRGGYEVFVARDGIDGLGKAIDLKPDLILSDVQMPAMDGMQMLRLLRARPALKNAAVIFLTTLTSEKERLRGYKLGVDDYLNKPVLEEELLLRVLRVLRDRKRADVKDAASLRGDLRNVSLASVLSLLEMERRTGVLAVERQGRTAKLYVREGRVVEVGLEGAAPPDTTAMERVFALLDWQDGRFELVERPVTVDDRCGMPTSFLLLEHARRADEASPAGAPLAHDTVKAPSEPYLS